MFSAFLLALMVACNSESTAVEAAETSGVPTDGASEETLDKRRDIQSVVEIPRPRYHARHILVAHTDATAARDTVTRSRAEAELAATAILKELRRGADFETIARSESDDGSASRGGDLGVFTKGVMHADFESATVALEVGGLSGVVETPFGFHIIQRLAVVEVRLAHILIQWAEVKRSRSDRTRQEAEERAAQVEALLENGAEFSAVAAEWSDGPFGPRGGDLGWFQKGQMTPQFDEAAFALSPGERSERVESSHGFHVILRLE